MKTLLLFLALISPATAQTITSMTPRNVDQGSPGLTLKVSGTGFRKGMKLFLGPVQLQTKIVNQYSMTATVPTTYFSAAGMFPVSINRTSNILNLQVCAPFTIPPQTLPTPVVGVPYSYQLTASGGCQPNP